MGAPEFELPYIELPYEVAGVDPVTVKGDQVAADGGILVMPPAGADAKPVYISREMLEAQAALASALLNFVPIVGNIKGAIEGFTGEDLITGRHLEWYERVLNLACAIPGEPAEAEEALQVVHAVSVMHKAAEALHEGAEIAHHVIHTTHLVHDWEEAVEAGEKNREMNEPGAGETEH